MDEVTIFLALMDYLPVIFFGVGALYLLRIGYVYLTRGFYTALAGGAILCFTGGLYKATSKLMEASFDYCLLALQSSQFIMLAPGFVLLFVASLGLVRRNKTKVALAAAPGMELWKIPFIAIMSLANIAFLVVMAIFSFKNRLRSPAVLYLLSILTLLFMSYLSTQPMTTKIQWIAQGVNSMVQLLAMAGHYILYRGLFHSRGKKHSAA